jgi:hypothetical protein
MWVLWGLSNCLFARMHRISARGTYACLSTAMCCRGLHPGGFALPSQQTLWAKVNLMTKSVIITCRCCCCFYVVIGVLQHEIKSKAGKGCLTTFLGLKRCSSCSERGWCCSYLEAALRNILRLPYIRCREPKAVRDSNVPLVIGVLLQSLLPSSASSCRHMIWC